MDTDREFNYDSAEAILLMDPEGEILFANPSAKKLLGGKKRRLEGKTCYEILKGLDSQGNLFCSPECPVIKMAKQNKLAQNFELQTTRPNGKNLWLNVTTLLESKTIRRGDSRIVHIIRPIAVPQIVSNLQKSVILKLNQLSVKGLPLTPRQTEVLEDITQGLVAKQIAQKRNISLSTARCHIQNVLRKLGVHSKLEALTMVLKQKRQEG
jgi:PAS domain S-box-containing protein